MAAAVFRRGDVEVSLAPAVESTGDLPRGCERLGVDGVPDCTGHAAWHGLGMLVDALCTPLGEKLCSDASHVLELGAGLGVPGLLAGRWAGRLTLTDNNEAVLERLRRSVCANERWLRLPALARVERLEWGLLHVPVHLRETVDLLLAADCVYSSEGASRLLETAAALLTPSGRMLLAYVCRWRNLDGELARAAKNAKLSLAVWDNHTCPPSRNGSGVFLLRRDTNTTEEAASTGPHATVDDKGALTLTPAMTQVQPGGASPASLVLAAAGPIKFDEMQLVDIGVAISVWAPGLQHVAIYAQPLDLSILPFGSCEALTSLRLVDCRLGAASVHALTMALPRLAHLFVLEVSGCSIGAPGDEALPSEAFAHVRELDFSRNAFVGSDLLAAALRAASQLRKLSVAGNELRGMGFESVCAALQAAPRLGALDLNGCPLGLTGAHVLAERLPQWVGLCELSVSSCMLGDGGCAALSRGLASLTQLTYLDLSSNALGDSGLETLSRTLGDSNVQHLLLSNGSVSAVGVRALFEWWLIDSPVKHLELQGHLLDECAALAVAEWLPDTRLHTLELADNSIGDSGCLALANVLHRCSTLLWLSLRLNEVSDQVIAQVKALFPAAKRCDEGGYPTMPRAEVRFSQPRDFSCNLLYGT
ncbi:hypothetical protein AB1Y20_019373 [Prymnesium parvum]|uniref:Calmodulin-lysine N-methyltransferase n=1 Tax=Prymnesium parvum TaxID=97485 RepID=A0AB34JS92_PRYPA